MYGCGEVALERVTDAQGMMGEDGRKRLEQTMGAFEVAFPQVWGAVYVTSLGSAPGLRQFGFWLLNRGAVVGAEITRPNENGVLMLIDPSARLAALTLGYQLERWLPEAALERVLGAGRREFLAGRLADGAVRIVDELGVVLRASLRAPAPATDDSRPAAPLAGLRRLRGGERSISTSTIQEGHES